MRRKYTVAQFAERIHKVREVLPQFALTSDVIVGFPGETEKEFMNTYRFIEQMGFAELHVFPYSKRTGTPAARMPDQVDETVKQERVQRLIDLSNRIATQYARQFQGQILEVIPETEYQEKPGSGLLVGYTDNYLRVVFKASQDHIGQLVKVRIDEANYPYNIGTLVSAERTPITTTA